MSIVNRCGVQSLSMRSASVILPQLLLSKLSNWLQIWTMSFSAILPISLSLYTTYSALLQESKSTLDFLPSSKLFYLVLEKLEESKECMSTQCIV